jgi:SAM-dependent methyltransferase
MSASFWEQRYASGGNSGTGSEGENAAFKAEFLNDFVVDHAVRDVVEYGCGDGRQLAFANYPKYTGLDVSATAIRMCEQRFAGDPAKEFHLLPLPWPVAADLVLSLDVIYHLTEQDVYVQHMHDVFNSALQWVVLYTTDSDYLDPSLYSAGHVRHWPVEAYVAKAFPAWKPEDVFLNPRPELGGSDFFVYRR